MILEPPNLWEPVGPEGLGVAELTVGEGYAGGETTATIYAAFKGGGASYGIAEATSADTPVIRSVQSNPSASELTLLKVKYTAHPGPSGARFTAGCDPNDPKASTVFHHDGIHVAGTLDARERRKHIV